MTDWASKIKLFVTDLDGTLTDGMMIFDHLGNVSKAFNTRDMHALWQLKFEAVDIMVLTGSDHPCNMQRMTSMHMLDKLHDQVQDKLTYLRVFCGKNHILLSDVAFIGDADNDIDCMKAVGWSACPADAIDEVREVAQYRSNHCGGHGAVFDFAQQVIKVNKGIQTDRWKE